MGSIWNNSAPEGLVQAARPPWSHGSGVDTRTIAQRRTHCLGERAFRPRAALRHCSVHGPLQARIWSGSPFPPAEDLPDPELSRDLWCLLRWQADPLPLSHPGSQLPAVSCPEHPRDRAARRAPAHGMWPSSRHGRACGLHTGKRSACRVGTG